MVTPIHVEWIASILTRAPISFAQIRSVRDLAWIWKYNTLWIRLQIWCAQYQQPWRMLVVSTTYARYQCMWMYAFPFYTNLTWLPQRGEIDAKYTQRSGPSTWVMAYFFLFLFEMISTWSVSAETGMFELRYLNMIWPDIKSLKQELAYSESATY